MLTGIGNTALVAGTTQVFLRLHTTDDFPESVENQINSGQTIELK